MRIGPGYRLFPQHQYKSWLFVKLCILAGIDILILSGITIWFNVHPDISIYIGAIYQSLLMLNLGLAIACRFAAPRFYLAFLINSVLSVVLFRVILFVFFKSI